MNIPPKYEDVVAQLGTERELHKLATETLGQFADENQKMHANLAALREELSGANEQLRMKSLWIAKLIPERDDLQQRLTVAEQDNESLRSQIGREKHIFDMAADELVKDAARYRWLMSGAVLNGTLGICGGWIDFEFKDDARQQIDEAMQAEVATEFNQAADRKAAPPDYWPCRDAEEFARFEAWIIEDNKSALKPVEEGKGS